MACPSGYDNEPDLKETPATQSLLKNPLLVTGIRDYGLTPNLVVGPVEGGSLAVKGQHFPGAVKVDDIPGCLVPPHRKPRAGKCAWLPWLRIIRHRLVVVKILTVQIKDGVIGQLDEVVQTLILKFLNLKRPLRSERLGNQ